MAEWIEGRVVDKQIWTERLCSLRIEAPMDDFRAGQFARVALDVDGERVGRPYSLVNAPGERPLEIYFNEVPEGPLSPRLSDLQTGDDVWISAGAQGFFTLDEVPEADHLWMLATGTALGVFLSILKTQEPWRRFRRVVLVHGVRTAEELTYLDTIEGIRERHPGQFKYLPALSREQDDVALHGRLPGLLAEGDLERAAELELSPEHTQLMLCGNQGMITDTIAHLETRGFRRNRRREPGHITTEKYW